MTPQIFAAMYVTALKFHNEKGASSYFELASKTVEFHKQDQRWVTPIELLLRERHPRMTDWARRIA